MSACFCGATSHRRVVSGTFDRMLVQDYPFEVVRCTVCGLARTLPLPDTSQYGRGYEPTTAGGRFVGSAEDAWSASIVEDIHRVVSSGRLLDVGCAVGNLVAAAHARGYEAQGIDLDPVATAEGRRLGRAVRVGAITDLQESFDIVVMNHLLEHIVDLRSFLGDVARVLVPGGRAFVYVPHHRGLMPRLMRSHWMGWVASQHVWHFTPKTLAHVVETTSPLRVERCTTIGAIEPASPGLKGTVKKVVAACSQTAGWGDQIEATFRKPPASSP